MDTSNTKAMIRDWRDFQNINEASLFISVDLELSLYRSLERDEYTKKKKRCIPCHSLFASFLRLPNQFYICTVRLRYDSSLSDIQIHTYLHNYTKKKKKKTKNANYIFETASDKSNFPVHCVTDHFVSRQFVVDRGQHCQLHCAPKNVLRHRTFDFCFSSSFL